MRRSLLGHDPNFERFHSACTQQIVVVRRISRITSGNVVTIEVESLAYSAAQWLHAISDKDILQAPEVCLMKGTLVFNFS